eukprot:3560335-Prymnesium_polylepis.1
MHGSENCASNKRSKKGSSLRHTAATTSPLSSAQPASSFAASINGPNDSARACERAKGTRRFGRVASGAAHTTATAPKDPGSSTHYRYRPEGPWKQRACHASYLSAYSKLWTPIAGAAAETRGSAAAHSHACMPPSEMPAHTVRE